MKLPYKYKNIRKKDFVWLIKITDKFNETRNNDLPDNIGLFEMPQERTNYYRDYFKIIKEEIFNNYLTFHQFKLAKGISSKLNFYEYCIIRMYTMYNVYGELNQQLRVNENIRIIYPYLKLYAILLNKALNKLPSFSNKVVYRFLNNVMDNEAITVLDTYQNKIGKRHSFFQFASSHCDYCQPNEYVSFKIFTKNKSKGKFIKNISSIDNEEEVLFKTRSTFKVISVNHEENRIILNEKL